MYFTAVFTNSFPERLARTMHEKYDFGHIGRSIAVTERDVDA